MVQPERKSRETILKELADLRRQLSDLEQQVVSLDPDSDVSAGGQPATLSSHTHRVPTTITQPMTSLQLGLESITIASQLLAAETNLEQMSTLFVNAPIN